ncbi:MAG: hypothetical protein ACFFB0_05850 [Promethearchaeota archaeon]
MSIKKRIIEDCNVFIEYISKYIEITNPSRNMLAPMKRKNISRLARIPIYFLTIEILKNYISYII